MEQLNLPSYPFEIRNQAGQRVILDQVRKRFVPLTPEEWVRQHFVQYLIRDLDVPLGLIGLEVAIPIQDRHYRADILIYDRRVEPVMIVECKRPSVQLRQDTFDQIGHYNTQLKVPYLVITNGMQHYCCMVDHAHRFYRFLDEIPSYKTMILPINHAK